MCVCMIFFDSCSTVAVVCASVRVRASQTTEASPLASSAAHSSLHLPAQLLPVLCCPAAHLLIARRVRSPVAWSRLFCLFYSEQIVLF